MELLDFIREHSDWEDLLSNAPYYLKIKHDGPYTMLSYQQFVSDLSIHIVQQARGIVIDENLDIVSYAMDKFFNYGEPEAAEIDWSSAVVTEKIDGSLMKLAPIEGGWLLSTNNTINAFSAPINDISNFGNLFVQIVGGQAAYKNFLQTLDRNYCYFFEMVSPLNRIVCRYDAALYYLGRRNLTSFQEQFGKIEFPEEFHIRYPETYHLSSIDGCLEAVQNLGENKEGFVVRDRYGNRVKIKSPWYLALHHLWGNNKLSISRVLTMWNEGFLDDFIAAYPEYNDSFIKPIINEVMKLAEDMAEAVDEVSNLCFASMKEAAVYVTSNYGGYVRPYLFMILKGKDVTPIEFIRKISLRNIASYIKDRVVLTEIGVENDE